MERCKSAGELCAHCASLFNAMPPPSNANAMETGIVHAAIYRVHLSPLRHFVCFAKAKRAVVDLLLAVA